MHRKKSANYRTFTTLSSNSNSSAGHLVCQSKSVDKNRINLNIVLRGQEDGENSTVDGGESIIIGVSGKESHFTPN